MGHPIAALLQLRHQGASLHEQLPHLPQEARQHLALVCLALGKEMVFFDRSEDRLHLCERRLHPPYPTRFELRQGTTTALRYTPQDTRFVGIANGQLLRCSIG